MNRAKKYLLQYYWQNLRLKELELQMAELRERATSIGSFDYEKPRVKTSKNIDASYTKIVNKMGDLYRKYNKQWDREIALKHTIEDQIDGMEDDRYREILHLKYIEDLTLEQIAQYMNYSFDYVRQLHGYALIAFEQKYLTEYSDLKC